MDNMNNINNSIDPPEEDMLAFESVYTDNFPGILKALNISLAVTSYQTHRLIFIRSDGETIDTYFKTFQRPMGIYADSNRLTLGTFSQVLEFKRCDDLLMKIKNGDLDNTDAMPRKLLEKDKEKMQALIEKRKQELEEVKKSDTLFLSRAALTTGMINIHDIAWGTEGLWVVNSTFSCLSTLSTSFSFIAKWKPHFISEIIAEDRCHLNGMALKDGKPKYVTTFNKFNTRDSWTKCDKHDGTLMDVDTNEILIDGLIMPHSPRYNNGKVYVCDSGTGKILQYDPENGELTEIIKLQGFTRGLTFYGPLMFVGLSQSRASDIKKPAPITKEYEETYSGIWIINLKNYQEIAYIKFEGDVHQIYDIAIIPDALYPSLINIEDSLIRHCFDYKEAL